MTIARNEYEIKSCLENAFPFSVFKGPLYGPDGLQSPEYGLWRDDTNEYVSSRSVRRNYNHHQTDHVVGACLAAASAFDGDVNVDATFNGGHYVSIMPTKEHRQSIYGSRDNIFPRFQISAKYGSGAYRASLGMFRDACSNMQMLRSTGNATSITIRHDSFLERNQEELIQQFTDLREKWGTVVEAVKQMEAVKINLKEFYNELYPNLESDSSNKKNRNFKTLDKIHRRILHERMTTGRPVEDFDWFVSGWEAYNGVQGFVQHDKTRKGRPSKFDRVISANNDSKVQQAELLVLSQAC